MPLATVEALVPLTFEPPATGVRRAILVRIDLGDRLVEPPAESSCARVEPTGLGALRLGARFGATPMIAGPAIRGRISLGEGGDVGGSGTFDSALVTRMFRQRLRAIQRCYETELRHDPSVSGLLTVRFTILERGSVSNVRASQNTSANPAVAACLVNTVRRFRFNPGPVGGDVEFSYGFTFAPQN